MRSVLLSSLSVMARVKKTLIASVVLLGIEFLWLGFFNSRSFACSNSHLTTRPTAITSGDATPVMLESLAEDDDGSVAASNCDTSCLPGFFSAAIGRWQVLLRRMAVPVSFSQILTPKVSRYISKSALIL